MELFKLTCATCATKLKVSQLSAIGQILACPRCGGMIQVEPPEGWTPPPEVVAAAESAAAQAAAPRKRAAPDPNLPATASVADFDDIDHLLNPKAPAPTPRTSAKSPRNQATQTTARPQRPTNSTAAAATVPPAPDAALSHAARQRQKALLLFVGVAGLLIVAASLVAYLANAFLNRPRIPPPDPRLTQVDPGAEKDEPPSTENKTADDFPPPADTFQPPTPGVGVVQTLPPPPRLQIPTTSGTTDLAGTSPPGMEAPPTPNALEATAGSLVDVFSPFDDILRGSESQESLQSVEDTVAVDRGRIGIGEVYVRPPNAPPIDVAQNLKAVVLEYEFQQQPLIDVLRTLSQVSAIPISVDVDLVVARGISLAKPVDGHFQNANYAAILNELLLPHGLAFRTVDNLVWVTIADDQTPVAHQFDLSVFRSSDPQLPSQFADFVARTFEPSSWEPQGGTGTLAVMETQVTVANLPRVVTQIETLYQKLVAAQVLRDDPDNETALRTLASRYQRARSAREAGIALQLLDQQPIESVLSRVARDFGPQVLIDWQSIVPEGWTPATEIPWKTNGESLADYLDQLANSMQLYVRSVDAQLLQLTSLAVANQRSELEVYSCTKLLQKYSPEMLRDRLDRLFENEIQPTTVFLEPGCQCLVAYVPQPLQIRLEAALQSLE